MSKKRFSSKKDIAGFKDFLEEIQVHSDKQNSRTKNSFDMIGFLENNINRIEKLNVLLEEKYINLKQYSPTPKLINEQEDHNQALLYELIQRLESNGSPINVHLGRIFNLFFRSGVS
ncbi:MAG: hypothetical protein ACOCUH_01830 [Bacteriovoracia bacterium]